MWKKKSPNIILSRKKTAPQVRWVPLPHIIIKMADWSNQRFFARLFFLQWSYIISKVTIGNQVWRYMRCLMYLLYFLWHLPRSFKITYPYFDYVLLYKVVSIRYSSITKTLHQNCFMSFQSTYTPLTTLAQYKGWFTLITTFYNIQGVA